MMLPEPIETLASPSPIPCRDHQPLRVAVPSLLLSHRDVTEILAERGVGASYETSRDWSQRFGGTYAKRVRSRANRTGDCWHLDEVYLSIKGKPQYLWRSVDQYGEVLDILVRPRRNKHAANKFFRKLLKGLQYIPRVIITDKLGS
jgi:putative transposase